MDYKIDVYPPGAVRPDAFRSSYVVRDPKTGKVVYKNDRKLKNRAGQAFKRITWRDMQDNFGAVK
ncbi:hypothetical protein [Rhodobacter aestuarii]|uniref:hypothetical protein n=1 Tax=Rhodobacter aestuarii TaxID=453582 RepID=UPI0011157213|nr:hypothetical protein [Rhodobacter aestuarii]